MVAIGDARDGICEAIDKLKPRYLVIGSHGYGAFKRYYLHVPLLSWRFLGSRKGCRYSNDVVDG
jgi:hypothetical protein